HLHTYLSMFNTQPCTSPHPSLHLSMFNTKPCTSPHPSLYVQHTTMYISTPISLC
ncbi:uncharacterized protein LOC125381431, partial [Haliotis rufescens]|uniref:uncharacterized protein LOC125381431 n=1 Tax=Haliotis rufescens TaxID=6454 RepID=UPI00201E7F7E